MVTSRSRSWMEPGIKIYGTDLTQLLYFSAIAMSCTKDEERALQTVAGLEKDWQKKWSRDLYGPFVPSTAWASDSSQRAADSANPRACQSLNHKWQTWQSHAKSGYSTLGLTWLDQERMCSQCIQCSLSGLEIEDSAHWWGCHRSGI